MSHRILLADDNAKYTLLCMQQFLKEPPGFIVETALTPTECMEKLADSIYDLVILDIDFGVDEVDGFSLITKIKGRYPGISIVMHTNSNERDAISRAMRLGADDFASKANSLKVLAASVRAQLNRRNEAAAIAAAASAIATRVGAAFRSKAMQGIFADIARYRRAPDLNILIRGQSGTGKELIAKAIGRKDEGAPFIAVNCPAIADGMTESELFGHVRGAFTGAIRDHKGKLEQADGGDIFLDEVACLPIGAQEALLRAIQDKEISRVGSSEVKCLTFRVIAATNEDLQALVAAGKFREELLNRLAGRVIKIPPLSERPEDILPIIERILERKGRADLTITTDCLGHLEGLPWPANVRQLEATIIDMLTKESEGLLTVSNIPEELFEEGPAGTSACHGRRDGNKIIMEFLDDAVAYEVAKDELLRTMIRDAHAKLGPGASQAGVAERLKIPRATLQRFLKRASEKSPPL